MTVPIASFRLILFAALYLYAGTSGFSQLCTGSLGDPVVKIDFGGPGSYPPVPVLDGYIFQGTSCPDDGYYTVARSSPTCFNDAWHLLNADHTGNGGYFLLINATFTPGDFYRQRIGGLCPGTTYEFAAWLLNIIKYTSINPNLLFTIETTTGAVLQSYFTGDIPVTTSPQWKQYGFFFTTPANLSEVVLRIRNNAPGGIGNDIAIDDITFRPCGPKLTAAINGLGTSVSICATNTRPFLLQGELTEGYNNPALQWQRSTDTGKTWQNIANATQLTYAVNEPLPGLTQYRIIAAEAVNIENAVCRISSPPVTINLVKTPEIDAGPDLNIFAGDTITFLATAQPANLKYGWQPMRGLVNPTLLRAQCYLAEAQTYTLTATTPEGCTATDAMRITPVTAFYVPDAFTPNADGLNDNWQIPSIDPAMGAVVTVYNRFGEPVYTAANTVVKWDGTLRGQPQPAGIYIYKVQFGKKNRPLLKGTIKLIR
jgi:gliding motility-associated-like protein